MMRRSFAQREPLPEGRGAQRSTRQRRERGAIQKTCEPLSAEERMVSHYQDSDITIHKFRCGPLDNNTYVVVCPHTDESVVIDTPEDPGKMIDVARSTNVKAIVITHNHMDHIQAFDEVTQALGAPVGIGKADADALPRAADFFLEDGYELKAGSVTLKAIATPGHTPGSTCLLTGDHLFTGDTLFPGGPGRTSSPGNLKQIIESITAKLFTLKDDVAIYPGHGDDDVLAKAKAGYAVFASKDHPADLYGNVEWLKS